MVKKNRFLIKLNKISENILSITIALGLIYLIINIFHLAWYIANPEGFWGFTFFWEVFRALLFSIPIFIALMLIPFLLYSYIRGILKDGYKVIHIFRDLGLLVVIVFLIVFKGFFAGSTSLWLTNKMSNKYSYITQSDKLINDGKFTEAFEYSEDAYKKQQNFKGPSSFFILSKLYSKSSIDKDIRITDLYAATINYAYCNEVIGKNILKAEQLYEEAIDLIESNEHFHNKQEYFLLPLGALAFIKQDKGKYKEADSIFFRLENISDNLSSEDARSKINGLSVFLTSSVRNGDLIKSREILSTILDVYNESELKKNNTYKSLLLLEVDLNLKLDNYNAALNSFNQLVELGVSKRKKTIYPLFLATKSRMLEKSFHMGISRKNLDLYKPWYASLNIFSKEKTLLKESESLLLERIEIFRDTQGEESLSFINAKRELASFYRRNGSFDSAKTLYEEIIKGLPPSNENLYSQILVDYISVSDRIDISLVREAEKLVFHKVNENLLFLIENDKETFISKTENQINVINNYYLKNSNDSNNARLYNNILKFKEIALSSNQNIRNFISNLPDSTQKKYRKLLSSLNGSDNDRYIEEKRVLKMIIDTKDFENYLTQFDDYRLIKNCLNENEYAVEITSLPFLDSGNNISFKYFAFIIGPSSEFPIKVELFDQKLLDAILSSQDDLSTDINRIYAPDNSELQDLIWRPLKSFINSNSTIFLSLSGDLKKVAVPSLFVNSSTDIHLVSSTRNIIEMKEGFFISGSQNVAIGDIDFKTIDNKSNERSLSSIKNNILTNLKNDFYNSLPYTRREVLTIDSLLIEKGENCKVFLKNKASEYNFRQLEGGDYNFIHLATHGFYFSQQEVALSNYDSNFLIDDSMNRSGFLLSQDPNHELNYENDGVITAREISAMDFSNVDLVVLSACDTGLGDYKGSEGVFGLTRAFKIAGVKKQIVSLWKVPDKETSELFSLFYQNYSNGKSIYESLKSAKRSMCGQHEAFYWAGFVLVE